MIISGYKAKHDHQKAVKSINKHINLSISESRKIIQSVLNGEPKIIQDDWILQEELTDYGFIVE